MRVIVFVFLLCLTVLPITEVTGIDSMAMMYPQHLKNLTQEQFSRIKNSKVDYIHVQLILGDTSANIDKLKKIATGKKILLQLWWGPGGRYNWSYHSLPGLAYEPEVRQDLFAEIDRIIKAVGPENIYGAYLLEECGFFGVDIDTPGDWQKNKYYIADGREDGDPYNNETPQSPAWSPTKPNVKRYNLRFKQETGLDMVMHPIWNDNQKFIFHRWCERTAARAEVEFFKHIKKEFPGIKTFTFYAPGYPNYVKSDFSLYAGWLDGAITDPYNTENFNYQSYRSYKTLYPDLILVSAIYGNYLKRDVKIRRLVNAYLGGVDIVGFFEGTVNQRFGTERESDICYAAYHPVQQKRNEYESMDWESPEVWQVNTELFAKLKTIPVFNKHAPILIVSGNWDCNYQASMHHYAGVTFFDAVPSGSVNMVDLNKYSMVIAHQCPFSNYKDFLQNHGMPGPGLDTARVKEYLKSGGILVIVNTEPPDFLSDLITGQNIVKIRNLTWQNEELLLSAAGLSFNSKQLEPFFEGCLIRFDKGLVWYTGFLDGSQSNKNYDKFMTDALRALLSKAGKKDLADKCIALPDSSYNYRQAADGGFEGICQFNLQYIKPSEINVKGTDIFTCKLNPKLGPLQTGIIVKKTGN